MSHLPMAPSLLFGKAANYRIVVQGFLHEDYAEYLSGMHIFQMSQGQTVLVGQVKDQAALSGVLNALWELHLPLVLVEFLGVDEASNPSINQ